MGVFFTARMLGALIFGANYYAPLLTTDSGGTVRSSYVFNPRIIDPTNGIVLRRYPKNQRFAAAQAICRGLFCQYVSPDSLSFS